MIKNIAVIFGGRSCEHEISILSALQVMLTLKETYHVIPVYVSKQGMFYSGDEYMDVSLYQGHPDFMKKKDKVYFNREGNHFYCVKNWFKKEEIDFVIPVLHGTNGEDGSIQGFLDIYNVPYAGASLMSAAMAHSKILAKKWMHLHGLPVLDFVVCDTIIQTIPFLPCIIKPDRLGSSIGIEVVKHASDFENALAKAFLYDDKCLIEPYMPNIREFNCSVRKESGQIICSDVEEVYKEEWILSFKDKYEGIEAKREKKHNLHPDIEIEIITEIQALSKRVYALFELDGIVRIDYILVDDKVYVNEINTIPGSYAYYLWKENFKELLESCIKEGLSLYQKKMTQITSFDNDVLFHYKVGCKLK